MRLVLVYGQSEKPQNSHQKEHSESYCLSSGAKLAQD